MDNLARNAMLAKQAGMSYGKWKAMQQQVVVEKKMPDGFVVCAYCGEQFKPKTKRKQKYCGAECCNRASHEKRMKLYREQDNERMREYMREKRRKEKLAHNAHKDVL